MKDVPIDKKATEKYWISRQNFLDALLSGVLRESGTRIKFLYETKCIEIKECNGNISLLVAG